VLDFGLAKASGGDAIDDALTHSPTAIGPTMQGVLTGRRLGADSSRPIPSPDGSRIAFIATSASGTSWADRASWKTRSGCRTTAA
jgi:hypothetical protein